MNHEEERGDAELERALAALPHTRTPSAGFTDRVVGELGLRKSPAAAPGRRWLAAAVAIFAAGLATGYGASRLAAGSADAGPAPVPPSASRSINEVSQVNVPEIGHSEVWY